MYENDLYNNICSSAVLNQDLHSLLLEQGVCENQTSDSSLFATMVPRRFGNSEAVVDFVSCNVANDTLVHRRKLNPVSATEFKLLDVCDSSASCLINQVPRIYGLFLNDPCFLLSMRLRSFIWPDNLPHGFICKCGRSVTPTHLFNCNRFITFRSKVHDAVRDQLYCMFKSSKIESFLEPLLSNLADVSDRNSLDDSRGDVLVLGLDGSLITIDVRSTDVSNSSNEKLAQTYNSPLRRAEEAKTIKYTENINNMNSNSHTQYLLCPFAFSLFGTLGKTALSFLDDFSSVVKNRIGRIFDRTFWQNRIVFSIIQGMYGLVSSSLLSLGKFYEEKAVGKFSMVDVEYEEIDF
ncbi:hypothetical protein P9112_007504 [Eukaryota sp. TZLM1-RC]